jgi:hypothetical protein
MNDTAPISRPVQAWKADLLPLPYLLFGTFMLGAYLFFLNESIPAFFQDRPGDIEWYAVFANEIFQPNSLYIAESMLLPLLAKTFGASNSLQAYRLLCAVITLLIVPALAWSARSYLQSTTKALVLTITFAVTFKYFWAYQLGFPDPLTILLLLILVLQSNKMIQLVLVILAGLSHFSMTLLAIIGLCGCLWCLPRRTQGERYRLVKLMLLGLVISKLLLGAWGFVFRYNVDSRFAHAWQSGLSYFSDRYKINPIEFWLTPGLPQLLVISFLLLYFMLRRQLVFALAILLGVSLAYVALFLTTDGLRVFAVVITPVYLLSILIFLDHVCIDYQRPLHSLRMFCFGIWRSAKGKLHRGFAGSCLALIWLFLAYRAKEQGLLVNHAAFLSSAGGLELIYHFLFFMIASLIIQVSVFPRFQSSRILRQILKLIVFAVMGLIYIQFYRQHGSQWGALSHIGYALIFFTAVFTVLMMSRSPQKSSIGSLFRKLRNSIVLVFK